MHTSIAYKIVDSPLELPLQCGVKVIAAHCGTKSGLFDPEYFHVFSEMIQRHPNLYGDSSAFNVPIRGRHVRKCLVEPLAGRILHGSDYPVPVHGHFAWAKGYVDWATFRRWEAHPNILERALLAPASPFVRLAARQAAPFHAVPPAEFFLDRPRNAACIPARRNNRSCRYGPLLRRRCSLQRSFRKQDRGHGRRPGQLQPKAHEQNGRGEHGPDACWPRTASLFFARIQIYPRGASCKDTQ